MPNVHDITLLNCDIRNFTKLLVGRSQNTVPIASTQVAIKGIVQYSTRRIKAQRAEQLATRHSREHTLSAVGPDAPVE